MRDAESTRRFAEHTLQKLRSKSRREDCEGYSIKCLAMTSRLKLTTDAQM